MLGIVNLSKEKFPKFQGRVILSTENVLNFVTLPQERNCSVMNIAELWKIYTPGFINFSADSRWRKESSV